ncbi:MAG: hypothetical protein E7666_09095 [Ruminococcaceae bacterium]|nr:hypothetical protein [Oscillospiraceae bacterium]
MNSEHQSPQQHFEAMREQSRKMRKKVLIALAVIVGAMVLILALILICDFLLTPQVDTNVPEGSFEFYPPYEGSIFFAEEYLALDRSFSYCNSPTGDGLSIEISIENYDEFDPSVWFLYQYVQSITHGDAEKYNSFFNATYYRTQKPKADFNQQMVYNTTLYFVSEQSQNDGSRLITYRLEYMIHQNDGSFRRDVGSDGIRPQTLSVRILADGTMAIESLLTHFSN